MEHKTDKPAVLKGTMWGLFSATATLCAFVLPAFILSDICSNPDYPKWSPLWYVLAILISALYHSLYRLKSVAFDLGFSRRIVKAVDVVTNILIVAGIAILLYHYLT